jgi:hypothetical protein
MSVVCLGISQFLPSQFRNSSQPLKLVKHPWLGADLCSLHQPTIEAL